jgi:hypothetical protein
MSKLDTIKTVASGIITGQLSPGAANNRFSFILQDFGLEALKPLIFKPGDQLDVKKEEPLITSRQMADDEYTMTTGISSQPVLSMLGTPVFCDMILQTQDGNTRLQLLDVLVTVDRPKVIVKTQIVGKDYTVKEHISNSDYSVRIQGRLTQPFSKAYPRAEMVDLIALCESDEALKVTSEYLQLFGIYEIVVEHPSFPQRQGFQNIQLFDLSCSSDQPVQLQRRAG